MKYLPGESASGKMRAMAVAAALVRAELFQGQSAGTTFWLRWKRLPGS